MDYHTAEEGWVYCIVNPRDRLQVKIGMTSTSMEHRLDKANTFTSEEFYIVVAKYVTQPYIREQLIHKILNDIRVNPKREFFDVSDDSNFQKILDIFKLMDGIVHHNSKFNLTHTPVQIHNNNNNNNTLTTPIGEDNGFVQFKRRRTLSETETKTFEELFEKHYIRTNKSSDYIRVSDVINKLNNEQPNLDVILLLQSIGIVPETLRTIQVYKGITEINAVEFAQFSYSE